MIRYEIDTTENGYDSLSGEVNHSDDLRALLFPKGNFVDCVGYIRTDTAPDISLCIAALKEHGVFLGCEKDSIEYLSLGNADLLAEVADVWGDGLDVSIGLFIPEELAWQGIQIFAESGSLYDGIDWITSEQIPEGGNYII